MGYKQNGFTIIELMIAVSILGVLSTIALASYIGYADKAHIRACQTEASAITKIVVVATSNNNQDLLPPTQISACASTTYSAANFPTANFTFTAKNSGTPAIITCDYQTGVCTSDQ